MTIFNILKCLLVIQCCNIKTQVNGNKIHEYENLCGDLAISCVANCPAFKTHCYDSQVANSIRDTGLTPSLPIPQIPDSPQNTERPDSSACSTFGQLCLVSPSSIINNDGFNERTSGGCCNNLLCFPFKHENGALAGIGSCNRRF